MSTTFLDFSLYRNVCGGMLRIQWELCSRQQLTGAAVYNTSCCGLALQIFDFSILVKFR
jgi:hypothetical protein